MNTEGISSELHIAALTPDSGHPQSAFGDDMIFSFDENILPPARTSQSLPARPPVDIDHFAADVRRLSLQPVTPRRRPGRGDAAPVGRAPLPPAIGDAASLTERYQFIADRLIALANDMPMHNALFAPEQINNDMLIVMRAFRAQLHNFEHSALVCRHFVHHMFAFLWCCTLDVWHVLCRWRRGSR